MKTRDIWFNLPINDIQASKTFFTALGFSFDSKHGNNDHSACMTIGEKNVVFMLFTKDFFQKIAGNKVTNTARSTEILFSISAESREEVHEIAEKVVAAGGKLYAKPQLSDGWMYVCAFKDLDGHRWSVLYMDMSAMPPQQ